MEEGNQFFFGPFRLDITDKRLWKGQQTVKLTPLALTLLSHLVKHPGRLVTKDELLRAISRPESMDSTLQGLVKEVRRVLGEDRKNPQFIETVPSEGYRFIAAVITQGLGSETKPTPILQVSSSAAVSDTWQVPTGFVGREAELQHLHKLLEKALAGERQIIFLSGEPGIGKTTLARAFLKEVATAGRAAVGRGQCIEQYGAGEPYLPVLEAIGRMSRGPGGAFIPSYLRRHAPAWLFQLPSFVEPSEYEQLQRQLQGTSHERMLRELLEAVELFTPQYPLVLLLEDLHWSDYSTLELLSALARRSEQARLLVIGTYRPAEGLVDGHTLRALRQELLGHQYCSELELSGLRKEDVEQYLTKRFPASTFPPWLVLELQRRTEGSPFFLVNLVNDLVEQNLLKEERSGWVLQCEPEVIATQIPETSRQLIERQMERLPLESAQVLEAASVVGTEFSTTAVAAALEISSEGVEILCESLVRREEFLRRAGRNEWPDGTQAVRYAFHHALHQELWHERVPVQRSQRLHQRVAERLEEGYRNRTGEIAVELAIHFEEGRDYNKALHYRTHAADSAVQRHAYREAVMHLSKGLELLGSAPETPDRSQRELKLQSTLGMSLQAIQGYGDPVVVEAYARARDLTRKVREPAQLFLVLFGLWQFHVTRAEYSIAHQLGEQLLSLAQNSRDSSLLVEAHGVVGVTAFYLGELLRARTALEETIALYDPRQHRTLAFVYGQDPWIACGGFLSQILWLLGYPDQARQYSEKTVGYAQELGHPFSQAFALHESALLCQFVRDVPAVQRYTEELFSVARQHKFPFWELAAGSLQGWLLTEQGQGTRAIVQMRQGSSVRKATGAALRLPYHQACLATAYERSGLAGDGLLLIEKAFETVKTTGERWWEAELHRVKGELTLQQGSTEPRAQSPEQESEERDAKSRILDPQSEAETCFLKAIEIGQHQQAKSLELRATMSLARLWHAQGQKKKAHTLLSTIYRWFTEGFGTADLQEAMTLLTMSK